MKKLRKRLLKARRSIYKSDLNIDHQHAAVAAINVLLGEISQRQRGLVRDLECDMDNDCTCAAGQQTQ